MQLLHTFCTFCTILSQGVIRFLNVRQSWSNLWANLVINIMRCQSYDKNGETCDGNWPLTWPGGPGSSAFRLRPIKIFENETLKKKEKVSIPRSIKTKCHSMLTRWAAGLSIFGLGSDQPPVVGVVMSYFPGMVVKTREHKESNIFEKCDFAINVFYNIKVIAKHRFSSTQLKLINDLNNPNPTRNKMT